MKAKVLIIQIIVEYCGPYVHCQDMKNMPQFYWTFNVHLYSSKILKQDKAFCPIRIITLFGIFSSSSDIYPDICTDHWFPVLLRKADCFKAVCTDHVNLWKVPLHEVLALPFVWSEELGDMIKSVTEADLKTLPTTSLSYTIHQRPLFITPPPTQMQFSHLHRQSPEGFTKQQN